MSADEKKLSSDIFCDVNRYVIEGLCSSHLCHVSVYLSHYIYIYITYNIYFDLKQQFVSQIYILIKRSF